MNQNKAYKLSKLITKFLKEGKVLLNDSLSIELKTMGIIKIILEEND